MIALDPGSALPEVCTPGRLSIHRPADQWRSRTACRRASTASTRSLHKESSLALSDPPDDLTVHFVSFANTILETID